MEVFSFISRLHPLILHLPIGIFVFVCIMEFYTRYKKSNEFESAIGLGLLGTSIFASLSCWTGWLLANAGDYAGDLLWYHKWGGIIFMILSWLLFIMHRANRKDSNLYLILLILSIFGLTIVGHKGASLTHGENFLWVENDEEIILVAGEDLVAYEHLIQPILKKKCQSCHNPGKKKGELDLSTYDALMTGGRNGKVLEAGLASGNTLLQRIHLPLYDKEHMPPKHKKQLTVDEISLLEWWIDQGALSKAQLKDLSKDENIETILTKYTVQVGSGSNKKIAAVAEKTLESLNLNLIPVKRIANESQLLILDLGHRKDLTKGQFKKLHKVAEQLVDLDLAFSNVTDDQLGYLSSFPNVERLQLQGTEITTKGLSSLKDWNQLKVLNLYGSQVDDQLLTCIHNFPALERLYLWQSKMSKSAIDSLTKLRPLIDIQHQASETVFGDAALKPPLIVVESDLFKDSLEVKLSINFNGVGLHYTTDGTIPNASSQQYEQPFVIHISSLIQAISIKKDWVSSEVVARQLVLVSLPINGIVLANKPSDKYAGKGAETLFDLVKGTNNFTDGNWIGYEAEDLEAVIDIGELKAVSELTIGALEASGSYIFFPKGLQVWSSRDGLNYKELAKENYATSKGSEPPSVKNFRVSFPATSLRYLKVKVISQMSNPTWHPAPGAKSWMFLDEIIVN